MFPTTKNSIQSCVPLVVAPDRAHFASPGHAGSGNHPAIHDPGILGGAGLGVFCQPLFFPFFSWARQTTGLLCLCPFSRVLPFVGQHIKQQAGYPLFLWQVIVFFILALSVKLLKKSWISNPTLKGSCCLPG